MIPASWSKGQVAPGARQRAASRRASAYNPTMAALSFLMRLVYFILAPFVLVATAAVLPMTEVLINIVLVAVGFLTIEALRPLAARSRVARFLLARQQAFETYYREHPPRPFIVYVFAPLLLPYWLFNRRARHELGLYRGISGISLVALIVFGILDYVEYWAPEIAVDKFIAAMIALLFLQMVMVLGFVIPLAVTIVTYRNAGRTRALWGLLGTAVAVVVICLLSMGRMHNDMVPAEVTMRAEARTEAVPDAALAAQDAALQVLWAELRAGTLNRDDEGWIEGDSRERARAELGEFYRHDEAAAFTLHVWPVSEPSHVLLQLNRRASKGPIGRALDASGALLQDPAQIPRELWNVSASQVRRRP
jgi:hypothetical protein